MTTYKLGVFGDSYADCKGPLQDTEGWQLNLCQRRGWNMHTDTTNSGESGAGNWWGMHNLLNEIDLNQYENIVFSVTTGWRLPLASFPGCNYAYTYLGYSSQNTQQEKEWFAKDQDAGGPIGHTESTTPSELYRVWNELFDPHDDNMLNNFISQAVVDKLFQLAENHNIVVLMPFGTSEYDISRNNLTIIKNLDQASFKEMQYGDPNVDWIEWKEQPHNDQRTNHLNDNNNKILAKIIDEALRDNKPQVIDFQAVPGLDFHRDTLSKYGKIHYHSQIS